MKKSYKIIWGILTPMPIVLIALGVICLLIFVICNLPANGAGTPPEFPGHLLAGIFSFYGLLVLGIFLGFLVHVSYYIHLVRNGDLNKDMKTLWVVLFLVVNILAMIVYWFLNVWPEPKPKTRKPKS